MELKELCEKSLRLFEAETVKQLGERMWNICKNNEIEKIRDFAQLVGDLSVDWLQKIFQYYEADRKEKKQDYTPKSLADFCVRLAGNDEEVIDMCAGSGALTIQKWNQNHSIHFLLYEFDEKVIPYLIFNMMLRNISCRVYHCDVLQGEIFHTYEITQGEIFGVYKEVTQCQV